MQIFINNITKYYDDRLVLEIDNFVFNSGKIYTILGLNGSGKSTLLNCIAGVYSLSSGEILFDKVLKIEDVRQNVSIVSQRPYLFCSTVLKNISSGLKFRKFSKEEIEKRIFKYENYFDINKFFRKSCKELSGGEGAKVAMLRTIVLETEIILLDEPTAAMDAESTLEAEKLIKSLIDENKVIIMVTHDLYQAERIADYVLFMDNGKIIEHGTKEKVFSNPENSLVRTILNRGN